MYVTDDTRMPVSITVGESGFAVKGTYSNVGVATDVIIESAELTVDVIADIM